MPAIAVGKIWRRSVLSFSWCSLAANALGAAGENIMFYMWGVFEKYAQSDGNFLGHYGLVVPNFNGRHLACKRLERQTLCPFFSGRQEKRQAPSRWLLCRPSAAFRRFRLQHLVARSAEQHCSEQTLWALPCNLTWTFDLLGQQTWPPMVQETCLLLFWKRSFEQNTMCLTDLF